MGYASFFCRPTVQSCSRQKHYGRSSMSRSSPSTSQPSRNLKRKSPTNASPSPSSPTESRNAPAFIGGQSGSARTNQPETVSDEDLSEIESVAGAIKVEGDRYPPKHLKLTGL